jgi:hypothetical protein
MRFPPTLTISGRLFVAAAILTLAACAGSPEGISPPTSGSTPAPAVASPAPAVAPPAIVFPTREQLASATKVEKVKFVRGDGPLGRLTGIVIDNRCIAMYNGHSSAPRAVWNSTTGQYVAIGFDREGRDACGRPHTDARVPYLFIEDAYILNRNQRYFVSKNTQGVLFECVVDLVSFETHASQCRRKQE